MSLEPKNGTLRLTDALQREVDELARHTGETPLDVLGKALGLLKTSLGAGEPNGNDRDSVYARWQRAGLIGCAKGLPKDLSTNPKHMEGFGRG